MWAAPVEITACSASSVSATAISGSPRRAARIASTKEGYVPRRRLSMRQITEVLRLNAQRLSYRQIAQSIGISASTVQSYLERAERAGLSWPLPIDLDDAAIEAQVFTRTEAELRAGRPEPEWLA